MVSTEESYVSIIKCYTIMGISQICKYIPGNIFQYASRTVICINEGISSQILAASIVLEPLLSLVVSCGIVFIGIICDHSFRLVMNSSFYFNWSLLRFSFGVLLLLVIICLLFIDRIKSWCKQWVLFFKLKSICKVLIIYIVIFTLSGLTIKLIPWALWNHIMELSTLQTVWRFALCWIAGFIVPGAPAGLGVREALFVKLFAPELGEGVAACIAIVFRLITTCGDFITFLVAWFLGRRVLQKSTVMLDTEYRSE